MAKLLIGLLLVSVVLNGLTFLVVVGSHEGATPGPSAGAEGSRSPAADPAVLAGIDRLEKNVQASLRDVTSRLERMERSGAVSSRGSGPGGRSFVPSRGSSSLTRSNPPAARRGPVDYSRVTEPPAEEPTDEDVVDETAPAPGESEELPEEGVEGEVPVEPVPAEGEGAEGEVPVEAE